MRFILSLFACILFSALIAYGLEGRKPEHEVDLEWFGILCVSSFVILLPLIWGWQAFHLLNATSRKALEQIGNQRNVDDKLFEERIGSAFDVSVVQGIFSYELHSRNEYELDLDRHHLSWVLLAGSSFITIVFSGFLVSAILFMGENLSSKIYEAALLTGVLGLLPGIVTAIFLKIWMETRANLRKTRDRSDRLQRQRIRLLLLSNDPNMNDDLSSFMEAIERNRALLDYLGLQTRSITDNKSGSDDSKPEKSNPLLRKLADKIGGLTGE